MKLRNLVLLGAGIGIGYALSQKIPRTTPRSCTVPAPAVHVGPGARRGPSQAQKHGRPGEVRSLDAIRKARGRSAQRLADYDQDDDAAWN